MVIKKLICTALDKKIFKKYMSKVLWVFFVFGLFLLNSLLFATAKLDHHIDKGFNWYKDQSKKHPTIIKKQPEIKTTPLNPYPYVKVDETKSMEIKEAISRARNTGKVEDVRKYLLLQSKEFAVSNKFKDNALYVASTDPRFYIAGANVSPIHQKIYRKQQQLYLEEKLHKLSKDWGIFFFYDLTDPEGSKQSRVFAPIMKRFADNYNFEIKAVSNDGKKLGVFNSEVKDNGIISEINKYKIFPSVFLVNKHTKQFVPLAWGMVTTDQLLVHFEHFIRQGGGGAND